MKTSAAASTPSAGKRAPRRHCQTSHAPKSPAARPAEASCTGKANKLLIVPPTSSPYDHSSKSPASRTR